MDKDQDVKGALESAGLQIAASDRNASDNALVLRFSGGEIVNIFDSGTVQVQGKNQLETKEILSNAGISLGGSGKKPSNPVKKPTPNIDAEVPNEVFVVYGHDSNARNGLEAMLRRWGVKPIILDQLASQGATIIEKLEQAISNVGFAIVLATPDDEGHRAGHPDEKQHRARQNVVLELGMMLAYLGRDKVAVVLKDPGTMERPSDIQGMIYVAFKDKIEDAALPLAKEMNARGYSISLDNL